MTTAEQLALAVLRGDEVAIRALYDHLGETLNLTPVPIKHTFSADRKGLRFMFFLKTDDVDSISVNRQQFTEALDNWIEKGGPLVLVGIERVEVYELS